MSLILPKLIAKGAYTWNGAVSNATTGTEKFVAILDYFAKAGTYTCRPQELVDKDMGQIFSDDAATALQIVFGLRLITRQPLSVEGIEEVQTGYGRKDEFYKSIVWLHHNHPDMLYRNLHLIPVFGCWKDLLQEPLIQVLERENVYALIKESLQNPLLLKYLPQIRSKSHIRSDRDAQRVAWAKGLCRYLQISEKEYRQLKKSGPAHHWQRQMSSQQWDKINFSGIPGKAMFLHNSQHGRDKKTVFERHDQVARLTEWVLQQQTVKFTGYPYELTRAAKGNRYLHRSHTTR